MDKIQKILIKAGRKDLAQEYFKKIAGKYDEQKRIIEKALKPIKVDKIEGNDQVLTVYLSGNPFLDKKKIKGLTKELGMADWAPGLMKGKPILDFWYT